MNKKKQVKLRPFHLALPTKDLYGTKQFYLNKLNCKQGREDSHWVDIDFFGHQLVFHESFDISLKSMTNSVDTKAVTVPHFGLVLSMMDWKKLADLLKKDKQSFIIEPYIRFKDTPGEQATMFFLDNNGYALELKAFEDDRFLFEPF